MTGVLERLESESIRSFQRVFAERPTILAAAPGRANLIGGHVDYNEGFVLPAAIDKWVVIAAGRRSDKNLALYSDHHSVLVEFPVEELQPCREAFWSNYVTGVAFNLRQNGHSIEGANLYIKGNVPLGAGLSSSAAFEVAAALSFMRLNDLRCTDLEVVKTCQQAEREFAGVQCGVMDQYASLMGKAGHALFLDCRSLAFEHIAIPGDARLLVCDTGVRRRLVSSEFNIRRDQCRDGVRELAAVLPEIRTLRDVSPDQFAEHQRRLEPVIRKRCQHVVFENDRVERAVEALKRADVEQFGRLMYESHESSKTNYEVSCHELDSVVETCAESDGVFGARLTGAGFGGSVVCLAQADFVADVSTGLTAMFAEKTGRTLTIHVCDVVDGAKASALSY